MKEEYVDFESNTGYDPYWVVRFPSGFVDMTRLTNGKVMCCICFEYRDMEELLYDSDDGKYWDICKGQC